MTKFSLVTYAENFVIMEMVFVNKIHWKSLCSLLWLLSHVSLHQVCLLTWSSVSFLFSSDYFVFEILWSVLTKENLSPSRRCGSNKALELSPGSGFTRNSLCAISIAKKVSKEETWKLSWKHPGFELEYPKKNPANQADPVNQKDCPGSPERIPLNEDLKGKKEK